MIPKTPEHRAKLMAYLNESVEYMKQIDEIKADISNVRTIAKEEFDITAKEFNSMVKAVYAEDVILRKIEDLETSLANVEIITGKKD